MAKKRLMLGAGILAGVLVVICAVYNVYFFSTTLSASQLKNDAIAYSRRAAETFLVKEGENHFEDFIFYVSMQGDASQTKSQELFVYKKRKSIIPFVERYYDFVKTPGSQMYLPVDGNLIYTFQG